MISRSIYKLVIKCLTACVQESNRDRLEKTLDPDCFFWDQTPKSFIT
jgi:hypothetical protein